MKRLRSYARRSSALLLLLLLFWTASQLGSRLPWIGALGTSGQRLKHQRGFACRRGARIQAYDFVEQIGPLLRLVAVMGQIVPDPDGKLPGRGASVHRDLGCVELAERRRAF